MSILKESHNLASKARRPMKASKKTMNYEQQKKELLKKKTTFGCWVLEAINILDECSAEDALRDVTMLYNLMLKRVEMEAKK